MLVAQKPEKLLAPTNGRLLVNLPLGQGAHRREYDVVPLATLAGNHRGHVVVVELECVGDAGHLRTVRTEYADVFALHRLVDEQLVQTLDTFDLFVVAHRLLAALVRGHGQLGLRALHVEEDDAERLEVGAVIAFDHLLLHAHKLALVLELLRPVDGGREGSHGAVDELLVVEHGRRELANARMHSVLLLEHAHVLAVALEERAVKVEFGRLGTFDDAAELFVVT